MIIIKVGGGAALNLQGVVEDLARIDTPALVVLGANAERDRLAERLGTPRQSLTSVSGYTSVLSDESAMDAILTATMRGGQIALRATRFVESCQRAGVNAVSLTGIDGRTVQGKRNRGIRVREGGKTLIKRDFSGNNQSRPRPSVSLLSDILPFFDLM